MGGVPKDLARQWTKESFDYYDNILFKSDGGRAGLAQMSGYQLFDDERHVSLGNFDEFKKSNKNDFQLKLVFNVV